MYYINLSLPCNSSVSRFFSFHTNSLTVVLDVVLVVGVFFSQFNCTEATKQFNKDNIGYAINLAKIDAIAPMDF